MDLWQKVGNRLSSLVKNYNFTDLDTLGRKSKDGFSIPIATDEQIGKYNFKRLTFYHLLGEIEPEVLEKALKIEGLYRFERQQIKDGIQNITKGYTQLQALTDILNKRLAPMPSSTHSGGDPFAQQVGGDTWYANQLRELGKLDNEDKVAKFTREYENHPIYAPSNQLVTATDRVIFIAFTYFLRAVTLYLIDWGIQNRMINRFDVAFYLYVLIYLVLFACWVAIVNMQTEATSSLSMLNGIFYYISTHGEKSKASMRIGMHVAFHIILLIIPSIITDNKRDPNEYITFEERRRMSQILGQFSFFMWVVTSFIAARM